MLNIGYKFRAPREVSRGLLQLQVCEHARNILRHSRFGRSYFLANISEFNIHSIEIILLLQGRLEYLYRYSLPRVVCIDRKTRLTKSWHLTDVLEAAPMVDYNRGSLFGSLNVFVRPRHKIDFPVT